LQQTVLRLEGLAASAPVIVCNEAHRFLVAEQLRALQVEPRATLLEPFGRNTAPAIALGAHAALEGSAAARMRPSGTAGAAADHLIRDTPPSSRRCAPRSAPRSRRPRHLWRGRGRAETGYGYIQRGAASGAGFASHAS